MMQPDLIPTNIDECSVFSNPFDLRHDLHAFIEYVRGHEIKRSHRSNDLSGADIKRLAKLMSDPSAMEEEKSSGRCSWVDFIDELVLRFKFVKYDTKGEYAGYTSHAPSFPDNFISFDANKYAQFIDLPLIKQEKKLLEELVNAHQGDGSEFYHTSVLGRLTVFSSWGSATGIMPGLDFTTPRKFLIELLATCKAGVWYSTASLIQYLKKHHPFFLIPKNPKYESEYYKKEGRYGNFNETTEKWGQGTKVPEIDADAFERVEGRYVERFLEGIPLNLGYIEVAYSNKEYVGKKPEMDQLLAFRVTDKLLHVMSGKIIEPKVTVQPNFEVHVESELYPVQILERLSKVADVQTKDKTSILKLSKKKVLTELSQGKDLDVIKLLEDMSGRELPQNIHIELNEWIGVSEAFTLYENTALFEGDKDLSGIEGFTLECISPGMRIVHSPDELFTHLETKELIPLRIKHLPGAITSLPHDSRTVFPRQDMSVPKVKTKEKKPAIIKREIQITFGFPAKELMEEFHKGLIAARCPIAADWGKLTLSFASQYEPEVKKIIKALKQDHSIQFEDIV